MRLVSAIWLDRYADLRGIALRAKSRAFLEPGSTLVAGLFHRISRYRRAREVGNRDAELAKESDHEEKFSPRVTVPWATSVEDQAVSLPRICT